MLTKEQMRSIRMVSKIKPCELTYKYMQYIDDEWTNVTSVLKESNVDLSKIAITTNKEKLYRASQYSLSKRKE